MLKPDPRTAVSGGTVMARIFEEAGLPAGVLQMLPGGEDVGEAMVTDPHVRVISFTGSTAVGPRRSASWPATTSSARTSSSAATRR